jgi:putative PIN family toxin of toxin-antitoxin system
VQVVLNTNVLVSGLAFPNGPPGRIVSAWRAGAFSLVASEFMLDELARILQALSHRTRFSAADVRDFLDLMRAMSTIVELSADHLAQAQGSGLRDPDDAPILATFLASGADCLVSGDKDLLVLAGPWAILSPADFCARHNP